MQVVSCIFQYYYYYHLWFLCTFQQTALRKRNLMKKFYLKIPIPLDFRVYFFNITNPSEVQEGQTPVVKEIGPYCYEWVRNDIRRSHSSCVIFSAYKEKIDVLENEGEDSLTYTPYETYFFNQERSGSLTGDDYVTVLHPLIVVGYRWTFDELSELIAPLFRV